MIDFFSALGAVFTIVILIAIGYVLECKGKISDNIGSFLSYFVVNVTLPCSVFKTVSTSFDLEQIVKMPMFVLTIMLSQILSMVVAYYIALVFRFDDAKKGSFVALTAFNNTLFMGLPVSVALFGESNSSIILYYYIASTILFWTVGVRAIAGKNINSKFKLPKPLYGMLAGFLVVFIKIYAVDFEMPIFITDTIKYVASMTTPLSMIFTGYALGKFGFSNIKFDSSVYMGLVARFIMSPVIFIFAVYLLPIGHIEKSVFIVQAFMPVMASQTIIARQYGVDDTYPAVMVTVSTLLSLIIIPVVKVLFA